MKIVGTFGNDRLSGTSRADVIYGSYGDDTAIGGSGNDTIYLGEFSSLQDPTGNEDGNDPAEKNLASGGLGNDKIYGNVGSDTIFGDEGNDFLRGGDGKDKIYGGDGADIIYGDQGNDVLDGGKGNDTFMFSSYFGNIGTDLVTGGAGADHFVFVGRFDKGNTDAPTRTLITDFTHGQDKLEFHIYNNGHLISATDIVATIDSGSKDTLIHTPNHGPIIDIGHVAFSLSDIVIS